MKRQILIPIIIVAVIVSITASCDSQLPVDSSTESVTPTKKEQILLSEVELAKKIQSLQNPWTDTYVCGEPATYGYVHINFSAHTTSVWVTDSMSRSDVVAEIISGINNDSSAHISATGGGANRIIFEQISGSGTYVYITTWQAVDPNGEMFSEYQPLMGVPSDYCDN